jgi:oxygen-dependent protoporphyrinogen oxidase
MTRVAIVGGGISGLTAAYELELARKRGAPIDWHLYEASGRLGGIVETTRHTTPEGEYILEGGPDAWVSEKPWARELAIELGLEADLIYSNDAARKTHIWQPELDEDTNPGGAGKLQPIPARMRLMVPEDLSALEGSPLFSDSARAAYAAELANAGDLRRAAQLREAASEPDESVATFVLRHFGEEVLAKLAAPLLSGVFGGDVAKLSVRAVMRAFVAMERDHGSLIAALQAKSRARGNKPTQPIFTSLRRGMASLAEALIGTLPSERLHLNAWAHEPSFDEEWDLWISQAGRVGFQASGSLSAPPTTRTMPTCPFNSVLLATPLHETRRLLHGLDPLQTTLLPSSGPVPSLLPTEASSAVLAIFCWPAETARTFTIPPGFGFLVPQPSQPPPTLASRPESEHSADAAERNAVPYASASDQPQLLACTFVDQKFPHRAPAGARILRAFFGGAAAETLASQSDAAIATAALTQLRMILGPLPGPDSALTTIRRWPRSLPQYNVGHIERIAQLDELVSRIPGLTLLGNSYRGVGLPDLIRDSRAAARRIASRATEVAHG